MSNYLESLESAKLYLKKLHSAKSSPGQQAAIFTLEELIKNSDNTIKLLITYNVNLVSLINPDYQRFYDHFKKYFKSKNLNNFIIK